MIAPLRLPEPHTSEQGRRLHEAHQVVAAALLDPQPEPSDKAPPIPAWRAWLYVAWVVVVTGVYFASMLAR